MKKLSLTLTATALMLGAMMLGTMAISANAQSIAAGAAGLHAQIQNATPVEKAACGNFGPHCPPGMTRVCGAYHCWCRRCY